MSRHIRFWPTLHVCLPTRLLPGKRVRVAVKDRVRLRIRDRVRVRVWARVTKG